MDDIRFALEPVTSIDDVGAKWTQLEKSCDISFFVSWIWIGTWLRCLPGYVQPLLLTASHADNRIGAAVLIPRSARRGFVVGLRQLHFNSTGVSELDCLMIEHNGFVGGPEANRVLLPALPRWFVEEGPRDIDELVVPGVVEDLRSDLPHKSLLLHHVDATPAFACAIPESNLETILRRLSSNARQQLRRSLRDCEALGELRCETARSVEEAHEWFGRLKLLHVDSWTRRGKRHAFLSPFFETFHRALIERGIAGQSVLLERVSAGDRPVGYLYNFRRGNRVIAYQSGFDGSMQDLRPGYVSHALAIAASAREGAKIYDFLAGDNRLKRTFANEFYAMHSYRFGRPWPALRLESAVLSLRRTR
jgi:CelD/BcsL family acetyltransferase involved in cellulose biosynthesis